MCTLDATDLADRERAWKKLLGSGLVHRERVPGGVRLTAGEGAAAALRQLIDLERECCAWIDYDYDSGDRAVTLTAQGAGEQVLAGMFLAEP